MLAAGRIVVPRVKVGRQHAGEVLPQDRIDHRTPTRGMAFKIAIPCWCSHRPDIPVVPVLAPPGFIPVDRWTRPNPRAYLLGDRLQMPSSPVEQGDDRSHAQLDVMHRGQPLLNQANRQTQRHSHRRDQRRQPNTEPFLSNDLSAQVQRRFTPFPAIRTPPALHLMLANLHGRRRRNLDDLPPASQMDATQVSLTVGTVRDRMLHHQRRRFHTPRSIVFWCPPPALLLRLRGRIRVKSENDTVGKLG